jgi:lipopolysaccharide transport system ATP-binding protein
MSFDPGLPASPPPVQDPTLPAIRVENLGKLYHLYNKPVERLKHTLFWRFGKHYGHPFWALSEINFEVQRGETFGVIGQNGSGKSTLLQILAGTTQATTGKVSVNGRVAALLELGSGFNPEFTGRENVFLNGMILGISHAEMLERFDEIAAFADIGKFIDQPVKVYSSGMFVRLAFAVAASVDADILLVDEALAVGDIFFRQKCYRRLEQLRAKGASILLVSHAMNEVEQFCERALLLKDGQAAFLGSAIEAVKRYYFVRQAAENINLAEPEALPPEAATYLPPIEQDFWPAPEAFLDIAEKAQVHDGKAICRGVALTDEYGQPCLVFQQGQVANFFFEFETFEDLEVPIGGAEIVNEKGIIVHGKNSLLYGSPAPSQVAKGSRVRFRQQISLEVLPGEYTFNVGFTTISRRDFARRSLYTHPELDARISVLGNLPNAGKFAVVFRRIKEPVQIIHFGVANLPGECQISILPPPSESL